MPFNDLRCLLSDLYTPNYGNPQLNFVDIMFLGQQRALPYKKLINIRNHFRL